VQKPTQALGFQSKVFAGPLTDLCAWVGFCTSSPQHGVKYQLWYLKTNCGGAKSGEELCRPWYIFHGIFIEFPPNPNIKVIYQDSSRHCSGEAKGSGPLHMHYWKWRPQGESPTFSLMTSLPVTSLSVTSHPVAMLLSVMSNDTFCITTIVRKKSALLWAWGALSHLGT
jgi:hypothetical protein